MRLFKFTLLSLACLLSYFAHAQENDQPVPPPPTTTTEVVTPDHSDKIFNTAQEMPRFPGCEDIGDLKKKKKCAEKKMLEYIYKNIKYPTLARENGIQGMVVVSFIVEKDGSITNTKILRNLDGGCDEEALRIVQSMPKWIPGKQDNQPIRSQFNLPVRFKIEKGTANTNSSIPTPASYVRLRLQSSASYSFNMRTYTICDATGPKRWQKSNLKSRSASHLCEEFQTASAFCGYARNERHRHRCHRDCQIEK